MLREPESAPAGPPCPRPPSPGAETRHRGLAGFLAGLRVPGGVLSLLPTAPRSGEQPVLRGKPSAGERSTSLPVFVVFAGRVLPSSPAPYLETKVLTCAAATAHARVPLRPAAPTPVKGHVNSLRGERPAAARETRPERRGLAGARPSLSLPFCKGGRRSPPPGPTAGKCGQRAQGGAHRGPPAAQQGRGRAPRRKGGGWGGDGSSSPVRPLPPRPRSLLRPTAPATYVPPAVRPGAPPRSPAHFSASGLGLSSRLARLLDRPPCHWPRGFRWRAPDWWKSALLPPRLQARPVIGWRPQDLL